MKAKEIFSIPNILSYVRILLIPVFIGIYINCLLYTSDAADEARV